MNDLTQLFAAVSAGEAGAADRLMGRVYEELRGIAAHKMAREAPGHTLQPTALVHEAWLRLGGANPPALRSRAHFFAAAAEAMRRILVDRARRRLAARRGAAAEHPAWTWRSWRLPWTSRICCNSTRRSTGSPPSIPARPSW